MTDNKEASRSQAQPPSADSQRPWIPEHPVDTVLAARLVERQFPAERYSEFAGIEPARLGEGWDNDLWLFGDITFRFPRRAIAVDFINNEIRILPVLAPYLPVSVPSPRYIGRPSEVFPYPFYGYRLLEGSTAELLRLNSEQRRALATGLATFLRALHHFDIRDPVARTWPVDTWRGDLTRMCRVAKKRLPMLEDTRYKSQLPAINQVLNNPEPNAHHSEFVLHHGDLYARHLLISDEHALCGIIDWGDVRIGDPAVDLSIVCTFLPPDARPAFVATYGEVNDETWRRARCFGVAHTVSVLVYALDIGDEPLLVEAEQALEYVLSS